MKILGQQKYIRKFAVFGAILVGLASFALFPTPQASAITANQQAVCDSIGSKDCGATNTNGGTDVNGLIRTTINLFSGIVGVVAVIMIVVAGFKYITSGGDSAKLTSAKNTLVYALIGIVIVVLSQSIVRFVLTKTVSNPSVTCPAGQLPDATGTKCIKGN